MAHNNNVDYQKFIDKAVEKGDFGAAAQLERSRNEKIDDLGLNYEKTYKYQQYNDSDDTSSGNTSAQGNTSNSLSYSYSGKEPERNTDYADQQNEYLNKYLNQADFSYDPDTDPLYQSYKDKYTRQGQTAMEDTLGQISARTGGMASSYAGTAAQQTYDNYMQELSDKIPELQQAAYEMYQDQAQKYMNAFSMLGSEQDRADDWYLNDLSQYNTNRQFDYDAGRDEIANEQWNKTFDHDVQQDEIGNEQWQKDFDYRAQQDALDRSAGSSGGSSSGSSGGSSDDWSVNDLFSAMYQSGDPYTYLILNGYTEGEAKGIIASSGYRAYDTEMRTAGRKTESDDNSYMVEGMGKMSESDIDKLLDSGEIYVTAVDENDNPISFAITPETKKGLGNKPISLTR